MKGGPAGNDATRWRVMGSRPLHRGLPPAFPPSYQPLPSPRMQGEATEHEREPHRPHGREAPPARELDPPPGPLPGRGRGRRGGSRSGHLGGGPLAPAGPGSIPSTLAGHGAAQLRAQGGEAARDRGASGGVRGEARRSRGALRAARERAPPHPRARPAGGALSLDAAPALLPRPRADRDRAPPGDAARNGALEDPARSPAAAPPAGRALRRGPPLLEPAPATPGAIGGGRGDGRHRTHDRLRRDPGDERDAQGSGRPGGGRCGRDRPHGGGRPSRRLLPHGSGRRAGRGLLPVHSEARQRGRARRGEPARAGGEAGGRVDLSSRGTGRLARARPPRRDRGGDRGRARRRPRGGDPSGGQRAGSARLDHRRSRRRGAPGARRRRGRPRGPRGGLPPGLRQPPREGPPGRRTDDRAGDHRSRPGRGRERSGGGRAGSRDRRRRNHRG